MEEKLFKNLELNSYFLKEEPLSNKHHENTLFQKIKEDAALNLWFGTLEKITLKQRVRLVYFKFSEMLISIAKKYRVKGD